MRHVKRRWKVENTWKCSSCGHSNLGRHMKCQACGSPKEAHEKYDTSKNLVSPAVTDPTLLAQANAGKNWECNFCKGSVRNLYGECENCGGPKTDEAMKLYPPPAVKPQLRNTVAPPFQSLGGTNGGTNEERVFVQETGDYRTAHKSVVTKKPVTPLPVNFSDDDDVDFRPKRSIDWKPILTVLAGLSVVFLVVGVSIYLFAPHEEHVVVAGTTWTYYAHLQQRETHSGSGWDETVPSDAFNESCSTRQRGTEDCPPHDCNPHRESYRCNPTECDCRTTCEDDENGYSSCEESCDTCYDTCYESVYDTCYDSCPVYDDWCTYDYYTWPTIHTETLSGHDHNMTEPVLEPMPNPPSPQRVVREHVFAVSFRGEDEAWNYTPTSPSEYDRFIAGTHWLIEVNHAGGVFPQHPEN